MDSSTEPLVGREPEWRVLERAVGDAGTGRARVVGIVGEPGIGKSRLLEELGRRAEARGYLVVSARASELERDVPFALWTEALDRELARVGGEALAGFDE